MSNKQTAVEFYRQNLMALVSGKGTIYNTENEIFEQAKEMEKQQIIEAYNDGESWAELFLGRGEQFYKETYGE
jgi:hypothetical protein